MEKYLGYEEGDDRDNADKDFVYESIGKQKCRRCSCLCPFGCYSNRKKSAVPMMVPGDRNSALLKKRCCCCVRSRSCLLRCAIITLVVLTVLTIFALLLWFLAMPAFVSMYFKATDIKFGIISMSDNLPDGTKSSDSLFMDGHASIAQTFPFDIGLIVHTLDVRAGGSLDQPIIGNLLPQKEVMMYHQDHGRFSLPAILKIKNYAIFQEFASDLLLSNTSALRLTTPGNGGRVRLHLPFLNLDIPNVKLDKTMTLTGCGGFPSTRLEKFTLDDKPSKFPGKGLNIHARLRFWSASTANVSDMGVVHLDVFYQKYPDSRLGFMYTNGSLTISPGWNVVEATGRFIASGPAADEMIELFISGRPTPMLAVSPKTNASSDPLFSHFVGGLSLPVNLNGVPNTLITNAVMLMTEKNVMKAIVAMSEKHPKPITLQVQVRVRNPFGCTIEILKLSLAISYEGVVVGRGNITVKLIVKPYKQAWSTRVNVVADPAEPAVRREATRFLLAVVRNDETYLGLSGNFSFTTGGMTLSPRNYVQPPNIPSCLQVPPKAGDDPEPCHNRSKPHRIAK